MRYLKLFETIEDELVLFRQTIEMIFVNLLDDGFNVFIETASRTTEREPYKISSNTIVATNYDHCNVISIELVKLKRTSTGGYERDSFELNKFHDKICECFDFLFDFLNKKWNGVDYQYISRLDINGDKELFHSFRQPKLWDRSRVRSISAIIKKKYI